MDQRDALGDGMQVQHPIQSRIAAADDDHLAAAELLDLAHGVEDGLALEQLDLGNRRLLGHERAAAGRDQHAFGGDLRPRVGGHAEGRMLGVAQRLHLLHHLAHMKDGVERLDLLDQVVDEPLRGHFGEAGNVVNRLFRVEFGALAAGLGQNVDQMAFDVEQPQLEHREQARGARADDDDVGLVLLAHD